MASRLYFHGHPINRREARDDLRLKVAIDIGHELEDLIWALYCQYEEEFDNRTVFYPPADLIPLADAQPPPATGPHPVPPSPVSCEYELLMALIESEKLSSRSTVRKRVSLLQPAPGQRALWEDVLAQGWSHTPPPSEGAPAPGP
jgi:hypothetical protein